MDKCELYDVEVLDGYFSGVAIIYEDNKRYIVDISYDIEFEEIGLRNSTDLLYNLHSRDTTLGCHYENCRKR